MPVKSFCLTKWIQRIVLDFISKITLNVLTLDYTDIN